MRFEVPTLELAKRAARFHFPRLPGVFGMYHFNLENVPLSVEEKLSNIQRAWDIYLDSFPVHERRAFDVYERVCRNEPGFVPYSICDDSGELIGLIWYWTTDDFVYLEHFAIARAFRNGGVGARILGEFLRSHPNVVLEVEEPVDDITRRRVAFYCRNGMTFDNFSYTNPGYGKTPIYHKLCLVSSKPMDLAQCQAFVDDFIFPKPMSYVG